MKKLRTATRVTEIDGLSDAIVMHYGAATAAVKDDAFLKGVMGEIEDLSEKITTAIKQDRVASNLEEADSARDEAVRTLGTLLDGYAVIPLAEKKASGQKLQAVFAKYGKAIATANYTAESSLIESMLGDFAAVRDDINKLDGVVECLDAIRLAQNVFAKASVEYTQAASVKVESASGIKKPLLAAINDKLLAYLDTMVMVSEPVYGAFARSVESEIAKVNEMVAKRKK